MFIYLIYLFIYLFNSNSGWDKKPSGWDKKPSGWDQKPSDDRWSNEGAEIMDDTAEGAKLNFKLIGILIYSK